MADRARTILDFKYEGEIQPIIKKWGDENGFHVRDIDEGIIECQRGGGVVMCPILLRVKQTGTKIHLETWLMVDILTQFTSLFSAPAQSPIDSSVNGLPRERDVARLFVNKLLAELGQPPIL